jgi:5-methylcytosine-specific restriction endonuclease McrA
MHDNQFDSLWLLCYTFSMQDLLEYLKATAEAKRKRDEWNSLSPEEQIRRRNIELGIIKIPKRKRRKTYYSKKEWDPVRKKVFERDGDTCYVCGGKATQVDHLLPKSKYPELALSLENLKPICWPCNREKNTTVKEEFLKGFGKDLR